MLGMHSLTLWCIEFVVHVYVAYQLVFNQKKIALETFPS